ncbi:uncharacterized protein B0H18DRAFT_1039720 [Fomitopsis serialis]|uniref:uncharacterized protein n=1 Tax=Fomitopsis serialis TaxID=139415 RepID=UPI002008B654|nr:uncharacterized protein B0H18DRAFT_1039720 [Neoantrodia serialis]KAH9915910.1 hypothetical protein B0H18DRAFT_1039720 [Neoantrodia serialis]
MVDGRVVCRSSRDQQTFDKLAEQMTSIARLGEELETTSIINSLKEVMDAQDEKLGEDIAGIKALQETVLKTDVIEHLRTAVETLVSEMIDELVKEQVELLLPQHVPQALVAELQSHKLELAEVERNLHNSESRRLNAQIRTSGLDDPLSTIYKNDGTASRHFPENLQALLGMDDKFIKAMMRDYQLADISDSREKNTNRLMQFFGISYQLVPARAGGNVLVQISSSRVM